MPIPTPPLSEHPKTPYTKPTFANTHGGKTYTPTHPGLFSVEFSRPRSQNTDGTMSNGDGSAEMRENYSSRLVSVRDFPPNTIITPLHNLSLAPEKAYSSVQFGPGPRDHFELNSDLLFSMFSELLGASWDADEDVVNHACDPTTYLDLSPNQPSLWGLRTTERGLNEGESVTFFYPSTEWDMAQGFNCSCDAADCLVNLTGANNLSLEELEKRGFVNEHIRLLKAEQAVGNAST